VLHEERLSTISVTLYLNCSLTSSARKVLSCVLIVVGPDCSLTSSAITALSFVCVLFFPFLINSESTNNTIRNIVREAINMMNMQWLFKTSIWWKWKDLPWSIMTSSVESTLINVDIVTSNNLFLSVPDISMARLFLPKPTWPLLHSIWNVNWLHNVYRN